MQSLHQHEEILMTHALSTTINQVDLASFAGLIDAIQEEPTRPDVEALHQRVTSTSPVGHTLSNAVAVSIDLA
jgi:hypothetical protein